jgi:RHS repeat-associated protein
LAVSAWCATRRAIFFPKQSRKYNNPKTLKIFFMSFFFAYKRSLGLAIAMLLALGSRAQNVPQLSNTSATGVSSPITMPSGLSSTATPSYIRTYVPQLPQTDAAQVGDGSLPQEVRTSTVYKDGFNRSIQAVQHYANATGTNLHLVQPIDTRQLPEGYSFLPYPAAGWSYDYQMFTAQHNYNNNAFANEAYTSYGITRNISDANQRAVKTLAPGKSQAGQDRGITRKLVTNAAGEVRIWTVSSGNMPVSSAYYAAGSLMGELVTDAEGAETLTYTTKEGRLVYSRTYLKDQVSGPNVTPVYGITYYVYNDLGQLYFILPPKATDLVSGGTLTGPQVAALCFQYVYDERGRKILQQMPGKAVEEFVYDKRDRLVLYQDGNLRAQQQWTLTAYDALDRPLFSGLYYTTNEPRAVLQGLLDDGNSYPSIYLVHYLKDYGMMKTYISSTSVVNTTLLQEYYYDDYEKNDPNSTYWNVQQSALNFTEALQNVPGVEMPERKGSVHGLPTGSRVKMLTAAGADNNKTGIWRMTLNWYDTKGRMVYNRSMDMLAYDPLNTIIHSHLSVTQYDFLNRVQVTKHLMDNEQSTDGTLLHTELTRNLYDPITGRLTGTRRKTDGSAWAVQSSYTYDELGRTGRQVLGNYGEVRDYSYNIRGQLTGINGIYAETGNRQGESRSFGESLKYDYGFSGYRYDGKIAGMVWRGAGVAQAQAYGYSYDKAGRLTNAEYRRYEPPIGASPAGWYKTSADYTVSNLTYDLGGNLMSMDQKGVKPGVGIVDMDKLSYSYQDNEQSNKLSKVTDNTTFPDLGDFNNTNGSNADYSYDANGHLIADDNKGISYVTYTHFNKPAVVTLTGGKSIHYSYDAAGTKVQELIKESGQPDVRTDYIGNYVYKGDQLQYALTAEGRSIYNKDSVKFKEEYFVKDHLGNVRSVVDVETLPIQNYLATFEVASANLEGLFFGNLEEVRDDRPGGGPGNFMAGALNGTDSSRRIGASMLMRVMAGDKVEMNVNNYYEAYRSDEDSPVTPEDMLGAVISTLTRGTGSLPGESHNTKLVGDAFTTGNYAEFGNLLDNVTQSDRPRAYLNYLFFDENMNFVPALSGAFQANGHGSWQQIGTLSPMEITANGYLAVYLSNSTQIAGPTENSTVYFDQVVLRFTRGRLKEEQHYYPHGLPMAAQGSTAMGYVANRHKYQGNEYKTELGLNWMDFHNRQYDPQIGRFLSVDPLADDGQEEWSPYAAMGNNPAMMVDPLGLKSEMGTIAYPHVMAPLYDMGGKKNNNPGANDAFTEWIAETAGAVVVEGMRLRTLAHSYKEAFGLINKAAQKAQAARNNLAKGVSAEDAGLSLGASIFTSRIHFVFESVTPEIYKHTVKALKEHPEWRILTYNGGGKSSYANRKAALRGLGKAGKGLSWDEFPYASTVEGGFGAQVFAAPVPEQIVQGIQLSVLYGRGENRMEAGDKFLIFPVSNMRELQPAPMPIRREKPWQFPLLPGWIPSLFPKLIPIRQVAPIIPIIFSPEDNSSPFGDETSS